MQRQGTGGSAVLRVRAAGFALLALHLLLVAWLTLRPLDVAWVSAMNLRPFAGIRADLALGPGEAVRRIGEGVLLLAPLGVLLPMADGRLHVAFWASLARTVTAGALTSLGIELLQTAVPGRVVDVDSLLLNTAGVTLAYLALVPLGRARLRRRRFRTTHRTAHSADEQDSTPGPTHSRPGTGHSPQGGSPMIPRVGMAPQGDAGRPAPAAR